MNGDRSKENLTIKDIAALAGVSTATVSYILNEKKGVKISDGIRRKVLEVCKQHHYTLHSPKTRASKNNGKKSVTISDIAREAGVSTALVSYIVNDRQDVKIAPETRKKVLQICNLRQYRPSPIAQMLAGNKSNMIGICYNYGDSQPARNSQNLQLLTELQAALQNSGYSTLLLPVTRDNSLIQKDIDGIICIDLSEQQFYHLKENYYVPIVAIDMTIADSLFFKTYNDWRAVVAYSKGVLHADKIVYVTEEYRNQPYMAKLKRALSNDTLYIAHALPALREFLLQRQNQAFVFDEETLALWGLPFLNPQRAAVICGDPDHTVTPPFERICVPSRLKAEAAVTMLQNAVNRKETEPHTIKISPASPLEKTF